MEVHFGNHHLVILKRGYTFQVAYHTVVELFGKYDAAIILLDGLTANFDLKQALGSSPTFTLAALPLFTTAFCPQKAFHSWPSK